MANVSRPELVTEVNDCTIDGTVDLYLGITFRAVSPASRLSLHGCRGLLARSLQKEAVYLMMVLLIACLLDACRV